jgi:hypothetical protein
MASFNKFNPFVANLANGGMNLGSDALKMMLTNTAPVATNSVYSDVSGTELANGNGYTTGGLATSTTSSSQTAGLYKLIVGSPTLTASGSVGPFRYAILYDTVGSKDLIGWWDYGSSITLNSGDTFQISTDAVNGVIQLT